MKAYIEAFGSELRFPTDAIADLSAAYESMMKSAIATRFLSVFSDYAAGKNPGDWKALLAELTDGAPAVGVSPYTLHLLLFVLLSAPLWERYQVEGLSRDLWKNSMEDLRCKLHECRNLYGVNGTFVASWLPRFFEVTRFGIGRLEFETDKLSHRRELDGVTYPVGTPVVKVHIPSKGKLWIDDCREAFSRAVAFYRRHAPDWVVDGKVIFTCHSWLLDPRLATVLPSHSNILKFASLFTIVEAEVAEKNDCMWRIYYADCDKVPADLPRNTALQAAYADFLLAGNLPGEGYGMRIESV